MNAAATLKVFSQDLTGRRDESWFVNTKQDFLPAEELSMCIQGCVLNDRLSQKKIYNSFYNYAMTICNRYCNNYDDAVEILNDGFLKVFKEVGRYSPSYADVVSSFKGWLRKIMIYTAIDHFRKNNKHRFKKELDNEVVQVAAESEDAVDKIAYDEILKAVQKLTPGYRVIFNLFVIEGLSHEEIATQLGITIGASKSNLARGRQQLQKILFRQNQRSVSYQMDRSKSSLKIVLECS